MCQNRHWLTFSPLLVIWENPKPLKVLLDRPPAPTQFFITTCYCICCPVNIKEAERQVLHTQHGAGMSSFGFFDAMATQAMIAGLPGAGLPLMDLGTGLEGLSFSDPGHQQQLGQGSLLDQVGQQALNAHAPLQRGRKATI